MRLALADTGPLYAAVDPDDAHHVRALEDIARLERSRHEVVIAYPVLLEAYTLVLRRLGHATAANWLEDLLQSASWVNADGSDYHAAAMLVSRFPDQAITLVDATVAVLAARLGAMVWTYDHHFDAMQARVWR